MKRLSVDALKCVGCLDCELVCAMKHFKTHSRGLSAISCIKFDEISRDVPVICQQCEKPACMAVCPVGAISANSQTGAKIVDFSLCIGCRMCVSACPFGAIFWNDAEKKPIKCDLCDGEPECVKICPSEAIVYTEETKMELKKRREVISKIHELLNLIVSK
ncbi:MAG: 4Fe-4S dicluster domain-containing protein [Elusimicrobiota bacterium]